MSQPPLSAVVIGSGVGGSAAACLLAHAGIPTTLLEKNARLGGSCSYYRKRGFHMDVGTHMFSRGSRGPLGQVLRRVGHPGAIAFRRTNDIAELRMASGETWGSDVLRIPVPAQLRRHPYFLLQVARAMHLTPREAARALRLLTHILSMSDEQVEAWNHRTVEEFITRFTDHAPTIGLFGFLLGLYFILPYWEVSAGEALWCFRNMVADNALSYPIGGSVAVPGTYCRLAEGFGAQVRTRAGARRIVVEGGQVRGVELEGGELLPARIVISTSSLRTTATALVGAEHLPAEYVRRAEQVRGSYVAVQAKIALDRKLVDAGAIVGGVGERAHLFEMDLDDLKEMFEAVRRGEVPEVVPYYCPVPTNFDPALAPPGCQLLTVCALAPTSDVALRDAAPAWEEAMLRALRRVIPNLDRHTLFVDRLSVQFIEHWIGKEFGPAVSTGQTPDQVGKRRPPVFTPIRGLYVAGCGAGGRGVGTELAATSAMECVDRILADLGRPLRGRRRPRRLRRTLRRVRRAGTAPLAWASRPNAAMS